MKASDLIKKLQDIIVKNGDINVAIQDLDNSQAGWLDWVDCDSSTKNENIVVLASNRMFADDMIIAYVD